MRVTIKNIEAASVQLPPIEKAVADIQETIHKLSKRAKSLALSRRMHETNGKNCMASCEL
jgi:hypothetical protein